MHEITIFIILRPQFFFLQELIEKKILKTGPYKPSSVNKEALIPIQREKDIRRDWKKDSYMYKTPPYILGYTGMKSFFIVS